MALNSKHQALANSSRRASRFLKTLANEHRMLILCYLVESERSVGELEEILGLRQATLSQQLARLRADRLVGTRRNGKSIRYSLASPQARAVIEVLHQIFCAKKLRASATAPRRPARSGPVMKGGRRPSSS